MSWSLTGPAAGQPTTHAAKATVINVTAGKPSELSFKLSKSSAIPAGTVTFNVTNGGQIPHDFEICTSAGSSDVKNSCTGKTTKMLKPGQSTSLTVTLKKSGKYEYLCTVPGHAGAGMKGLLGIGVKVAAPPAVPAGKPTTPAAPTGPTTTTCANPQSTTVQVNEFDYGFTLTPNTVPCGKVTFIQTNTGQVQHNFDISQVPNGGGVGAYINPGQTTTLTINNLTPGTWGYLCDVPTHAELGMTGALTVTG